MSEDSFGLRMNELIPIPVLALFTLATIVGIGSIYVQGQFRLAHQRTDSNPRFFCLMRYFVYACNDYISKLRL